MAKAGYKKVEPDGGLAGGSSCRRPKMKQGNGALQRVSRLTNGPRRRRREREEGQARVGQRESLDNEAEQQSQGSGSRVPLGGVTNRKAPRPRTQTRLRPVRRQLSHGHGARRRRLTRGAGVQAQWKRGGIVLDIDSGGGPIPPASGPLGVEEPLAGTGWGGHLTEE
ncbi:MAG: hypothetical protein Q9159_006132 [Coniocarpon cinnabarinum]